MNERLTPSLASMIPEKVESSLHTNAGAAVHEALRLPRESELVVKVKRDAAQMAREGKQPKEEVVEAGYRAMAADTDARRMSGLKGSSATSSREWASLSPRSSP